ncbi:unnamed protein product [Blepharisma stoltei]|uniref:Aurora kinase n=1 Tax=Blepharisma stoltei TaxID=1481888 RepID=A0AAU9JWJ2_9CILI|nr:unnamed protein product [Blepharisma stoltei]
MLCDFKNCKKEAKNQHLCPRCKKKTYCSMDCRLQDWYKGHQINCGKESLFKLEDFEDLNTILGKGSYGEVKLVRHKETNSEYALKIVNKKLLEREASIEVLLREISVHKGINHQNVIKLHEHLEDNQNIYLIIEYAEGGSLFQEIQKIGRLSEDVARKYFLQTVIGIQFLHQNQIVHRDIKPENILLDINGNVKICDFGWCFKGDEARSTFCGTLDYMAPEMVLGKKHSFELDIWALGVLLYEMLHGESPFNAARENEKVQQIISCNPRYATFVSDAAKDLMQKLLKVEPTERMPINDILNHAFLKTPSEIPVGSFIRKYVENYGMAEGVVKSIDGDNCVIFFQTANVEEIMPIAKVSKILKRGNKIPRSRRVSGIDIEKSPQKLELDFEENNAKLARSMEKSPRRPEIEFDENNAKPARKIENPKSESLDDIKFVTFEESSSAKKTPKKPPKAPKKDEAPKEDKLYDNLEQWCNLPSRRKKNKKKPDLKVEVENVKASIDKSLAALSADKLTKVKEEAPQEDFQDIKIDSDESYEKVNEKSIVSKSSPDVIVSLKENLNENNTNSKKNDLKLSEKSAAPIVKKEDEEALKKNSPKKNEKAINNTKLIDQKPENIEFDPVAPPKPNKQIEPIKNQKTEISQQILSPKFQANSPKDQSKSIDPPYLSPGKSNNFEPQRSVSPAIKSFKSDIPSNYDLSFSEDKFEYPNAKKSILKNNHNKSNEPQYFSGPPDFKKMPTMSKDFKIEIKENIENQKKGHEEDYKQVEYYTSDDNSNPEIENPAPQIDYENSSFSPLDFNEKKKRYESQENPKILKNNSENEIPATSHKKNVSENFKFPEPIASSPVPPVKINPKSKMAKSFSISTDRDNRKEFETQRELIEQQHLDFYASLEQAWLNDGKEKIITAPDIPDTNIVVNKNAQSLDEYDMYINTLQPLEEIEDYEKELSISKDVLRKKKKELERLIKRVNIKPMPVVVKKQKKKKEEGGFLRWLGGVIGCTDR